MVLLRHVHVALSAAVAALGSALFIALNYFYRRRVSWAPRRDYCSISEEDEERASHQVLVLGLEGAGKSSVLQHLSGARPKPGPGAGSARPTRPTRGFSFISLRAPRCQLHFLEIGGGEDLREYWSEYLRRTHVLVFVVDSSDRARLSEANSELHRLLRAGPQVPVVVLANKQDKAGAATTSELQEALSLGSVTKERQLFLLAAQFKSDPAPGTNPDPGSSMPGLETLQDLLLQLA
ncbi:ADP-ribosylation factor-like 10 [Eucyclogobius newberryi]|uniref:ADP-ribosylation factor-like 10 n=1 Tax=Eucyclogobius newberryi TaxID=166745 RepID=UPI003B5C5551